MKKPKAIRIRTNSRKWNTLYACLEEMSTRQMKDIMRHNSIPIPKMKREMVIRLASFIRSRKSPVTILIG